MLEGFPRSSTESSAEGGAFLAHQLREVSGRLVINGAGAPMHRRHIIQECLAHGAAPRIHTKRLPASAAELHAGERLWAHLKEVKLRCVRLERHASEERTARRGEVGPSKTAHPQRLF